MCGICGFNWNDKILLNKMLKVISHRGPDDSGTYSDKCLSLGHRRLSILDLSKSGRQPMSNEDGIVQIVYNGEIYNFKELRDFLEKRGHKFKSNTDTEVIIHLYEEEGVNCLKKLNGMFAFCIYDSKKKILFLARDRLGIKPLYYYSNKDKFIFCSEIKGILQNNEIKREINMKGVSSFLSFRANILSETCFKDINKLSPGNYMVYDLKNNKLNTEKYWDVYFNKENKSLDYFKKELVNLLYDSVKKRLVSDVPYGAYLSGGVDSGTVTSIMKKFCAKPIETFSVGFEEKEYSELDEAKFLSEKLETNHHELIINESSIKHLPKVIYHLDEPMSDPTSLPIYLLSEYTKKYCTVVLTGEGSDEIFAGYPQYKFMSLNKNFPSFIKKPTVSLVNFVPKKTLNKGFRFASELGDKGIERFSNFVKSKSHSEQYLNLVSIFNEEEKKELLSMPYKQNLYSFYSPYFKGKSIVNSCSNFDLKGNMVEDLLMKLDKNTMAFGVEGRVPFLDYRIVELAYRIPINLKLNLTQNKIILRETMKGFMPSQTIKRKKKHFFVPINNWFKNELLQLKEDLLSSSYIRKQGIFDYGYIGKINKGFKDSRLFYSRQLWSLITFQIWYKEYIENEKIKI